MKTSNNFRIIASMSDYDSSRNARFNARPLINKIGCIEYRLWDDGLTKERALEQFRTWAAEEGHYYDVEEIAEIVADIRTEGDEFADYTIEAWEANNRWYEGPGWYKAGQRVWDGGLTYTDDVWTWSIEEA